MKKQLGGLVLILAALSFGATNSDSTPGCSKNGEVPTSSPLPSPIVDPLPSIIPTPGVSDVPEFKKVFMIVFENTTVDGVLAQPYFAKFAKDGAFLTESYGVARPSQPNYLAMIGGSLFGVASNRNVDINAKHLGDLLEEKGKTWKVYAEGYPGKCNLSSSVGTYDRKHNPFISFINVSKQSKRCANIVNSSELKKDIANNTMADFSFYIPDSNNSGHDTGIAFADKYFQKTFEPIFSDGNFNKEMTVIVTFDEGGKSSQHIYTAISGYQVQPGTTYSQTITHYGLLRTLEEGFRLDTLGKEDQKAKPATGIWK